MRTDCDRAWINDREIPPHELPNALADARVAAETYRILLRKDGTDIEFPIEFCIASEADLDHVESRFYDIARRGELDSRIVDNFIGTKSDFPTAVDYCAGICDYLYGMLARERVPGTILRYNDYEYKFNRAAETLAGYDRPLARTVASLIELHFNHFGESAGLAPESRAGIVAARYLHWIRRDGKPQCDPMHLLTTHGTPATAGLDALLTDDVTENILRWSQRQLRDLYADADEIAACLAHHLPTYDQAKLHVLLAEIHSAHERPDLAIDHVRSLRHTAPFDHWAQRLLTSLESDP